MTAAIICIMGPTASGKTELAMRLTQSLPIEIISVDSTLVYRGLNIGAAKPDAQTLVQFPHRLVDILAPTEAYSAAQFATDAMREIQQITEMGKIPLLVGGTLLYFRALLHGLSPLPSADQTIRQDIARQAEVCGWAVMHDALAKVDKAAARRIHPNDTQRIQRALEVYRLTGKPLTELQQNREKPDLRAVKIALFTADRKRLHQRIEQRFHKMLALGFEQEVVGLRARGDLTAQQPSMRSVGYRQMWAYLDGTLSYTEMVAQGIFASRQLAKRQLTWLRREKDLCVCDSEATGNEGIIIEEFNKIIEF